MGGLEPKHIHKLCEKVDVTISRNTAIQLVSNLLFFSKRLLERTQLFAKSQNVQLLHLKNALHSFELPFELEKKAMKHIDHYNNRDAIIPADYRIRQVAKLIFWIYTTYSFACGIFHTAIVEKLALQLIILTKELITKHKKTHITTRFINRVVIKNNLESIFYFVGGGVVPDDKFTIVEYPNEVKRQIQIYQQTGSLICQKASFKKAMRERSQLNFSSNAILTLQYIIESKVVDLAKFARFLCICRGKSVLKQRDIDIACVMNNIKPVMEKPFINIKGCKGIVFRAGTRGSCNFNDVFSYYINRFSKILKLVAKKNVNMESVSRACEFMGFSVSSELNWGEMDVTDLKHSDSSDSDSSESSSEQTEDYDEYFKDIEEKHVDGFRYFAEKNATNEEFEDFCFLEMMEALVTRWKQLTEKQKDDWCNVHLIMETERINGEHYGLDTNDWDAVQDWIKYYNRKWKPSKRYPTIEDWYKSIILEWQIDIRYGLNTNEWFAFQKWLKDNNYVDPEDNLEWEKIRVNEWRLHMKLEEKQTEQIKELVTWINDKDITVENVKSLKKLDMADRGLLYVTCSIGLLTNLEELNLCENVIQTLPDTIGNLTNLKKLIIANNRLTSLPASIGKLTQLKNLNLCNNKLNFFTLPDSIGNLTKLENLDLSHNPLEVFPHFIEKLTGLQYLYLYNTKLEKIHDFGNLTELKHLVLNCNKLTSLPASIGDLTKLELLELSSNMLTSLPDSINKLTETQIHLNENPDFNSSNITKPNMYYNLGLDEDEEEDEEDEEEKVETSPDSPDSPQSIKQTVNDFWVWSGLAYEGEETPPSDSKPHTWLNRDGINYMDWLLYMKNKYVTAGNITLVGKDGSTFPDAETSTVIQKFYWLLKQRYGVEYEYTDVENTKDTVDTPEPDITITATPQNVKQKVKKFLDWLSDNDIVYNATQEKCEYADWLIRMKNIFVTKENETFGDWLNNDNIFQENMEEFRDYEIDGGYNVDSESE